MAAIKKMLSSSAILWAILVSAICIRIYFMIKTWNQPLWWDSTDYLVFAKLIGSNLKLDTFTPFASRTYLLSIIWAIMFKLGAGEGALRILEVTMSVAGVYLTYLLGKEMYGETTGIISASLMAVFWQHLFFSNRLQTEIPAVTFLLAGLYLFFKSYNKGSYKNIILAGVFLGAAYLTRSTVLILLLGLYLYLFMTEQIKLFKRKKFYILTTTILLTITTYFIWLSKMTEFSLKAFTSHGNVNTAIIENISVLIKYITFMPNYLTWPFLLATLVGLVMFTDLILGFDLILKGKNKENRKDLFIILWIVLPLLFFGLFVDHPEPRYLIYIFPAIFFITASGFQNIYNYLSKISTKKLAVVVVLLIFVLGAELQLTQANETIELKKASYKEVKDAALWIKENSNPQEYVITQSAPQTMYYAERNAIGWAENETEFISNLKTKNIKFVIYSIYEPHLEWVPAYLQSPREYLPLVKSYPEGSEEALLVVLEVIKENLP